MMRRATQKSRPVRETPGPAWLALAAVWIAGTAMVCAKEPPAKERVTQAAYQAAKAEFEELSDDARIAWQFGRACFDWAEFSTNDTQRAGLAREGIEACERALQADPDLAAAHYYLGMNQGQLARTMSLRALKLVHEMEAHFLKARELDPKFDEAGPDRNLGLLYLEAPGWPVSVGNRSKAKKHLGKAIKVAPAFPENRLNLMEAYAQWNQTTLLKREIEAWGETVEEARREFSGERWHWEWLNWERRLADLKQRLARTKPDLRSPKGSG